jgi:hypothetical protein
MTTIHTEDSIRKHVFEKFAEYIKNAPYGMWIEYHGVLTPMISSQTTDMVLAFRILFDVIGGIEEYMSEYHGIPVIADCGTFLYVDQDRFDEETGSFR